MLFFSRYYPYFPVLNVTANIVVSNMKLLSGPASVITDVELQSFALQLRSKNIGRIAGGRVRLANSFQVYRCVQFKSQKC